MTSRVTSRRLDYNTKLIIDELDCLLFLVELSSFDSQKGKLSRVNSRTDRQRIIERLVNWFHHVLTQDSTCRWRNCDLCYRTTSVRSCECSLARDETNTEGLTFWKEHQKAARTLHDWCIELDNNAFSTTSGRRFGRLALRIIYEQTINGRSPFLQFTSRC